MSITANTVDVPTYADGTYTSPRLSGLYPNSCMYLQLLDVDELPIALPATSGTATVEVSEDGVNWGTVANGTIDLTVAQYNRPSVGCPFRFARVTLAGVTGGDAVSARLVVNRWNF